MVQPFVVDAPLLDLPSPYPSSEELRIALSNSTRRGREIVVRLWLSEGPPFAFRACPAIYEDVRGWLSSRLNIHPKEVTLVKSARLGYSLAPPPDFGRPFGEHSDLDLSVISAGLFERLLESFNLFADHYRKGSVLPRSAPERTFWDESLAFGQRNIPRGFLDAKKIPNFARYAAAQQINQEMSMLIKKLEATPTAPRVRLASTRVYREWQCFIDQVSLNLREALSRRV